MEKARITRYMDALSAARSHRLSDAFEIYCSLFLPRCRSGSEREFTFFFRYQLSLYLEEKKNFFLSLPEGDMISSLIETVYDDTVLAIENSDIPVSSDGRINILENVEIVFPFSGKRKKGSCVAE